MPLFVSINVTMSVTRTKILSLTSLWDYLRNGRGIFSQFGVIGFANEADHGVGIFGAGSIDETVMRDISNVEQDVRTTFNAEKVLPITYYINFTGISESISIS